MQHTAHIQSPIGYNNYPAEVPAPPELVAVADRAQTLMTGLRQTRDRLSALHSRLSGGGIGEMACKQSPARMGTVGLIQDALDAAFEVNVEIDTVLTALERIG